MKKITLSLAVVFSLVLGANAQNILINDDDISTCSGLFWDSGIDQNYIAGENDTITVCSDEGGVINFNFIDFALASNDDALMIFDGTNTASELIGIFNTANPVPDDVQSSETCLTFVFTSVLWSEGGEGWAAQISCSDPCQDFEVEVLSDIEANDEGAYVLCPEESIQFGLDINFPNNNENYEQTIENTNFKWSNVYDLDIDTQDLSFTKGLYHKEELLLEVKDVNGCTYHKNFKLETECQTIESNILIDGIIPELEEIYVPTGESLNISIQNNFSDNNICYNQLSPTTLYNLDSDAPIDVTEFFSQDYEFEEGSHHILTIISEDEIGCIFLDTIELHIGCQPIEVEFESDFPIVNGLITTCVNETFNVEAITNYTYNDVLYHQSDATTDFDWPLSNTSTAEGQSINHAYSESGLHKIIVEMQDSNGCIDSEFILVNVLNVPEITNASYNYDSICLFDSLSLFSDFAYQDNNLINPVLIPDGGIEPDLLDSKIINISPGFITSAFDLKSVCLNLEHSFPGDLTVTVICPNGQQLILVDYPNSYGVTHFGEPCDALPETDAIGNAYEYCFTPTAEIEMEDIIGIYEHTYTNNNGEAVTNTYFPEGNYMPDRPNANVFDNLIGCPINGEWTLSVDDILGGDNGYFFGWDLDFGEITEENDAELWEENWSVESENPGDFVNMNDSTVFVAQDTGTYYLKYELTSALGCTVDTVIGPISVLGNMEGLEIGGDNEVVTGDIEVYSLMNESTGIIQWSLEGGTIVQNYSGDSIQVEWSSEAGYVMVTSENMNVCTSTAILYMNPTNIQEESESVIKLYPNPSQGNVTIEMESEQSKTFTLINGNGTVLMQDRLEDRATTINLSHLPTGMYLVLIDGQYAQKLILE